jgi:hypothetical protein
MALRRVRHPASSDANQGAGMWLRGRRPLRGRPCRSHPARSGRGARRRLRRYQIRFRGYGDGAPATTATPSATDSGGRGAYGGRPTTSGAGTPASGTAVAIDNFAFSPATLKAKGGPAGHLDQQAGRRAHRDRQRGRVQPSHAVGGDVLVHLHQGGHLRLPLHDPPIDARDGRGVVANSGRFRVLKRQCCRATSPHSHRARDNRGAGAVRRPVGGAGRRPAGRVTAPRWP